MPVKYGATMSKLFGDFALPKLGEVYLGKTFEIEAVRFGTGAYGEYGVVTVNGAEFMVGSKVLVKQLKDIAKLISEKKDTVEVTLDKVKRYYIFR